MLDPRQLHVLEAALGAVSPDVSNSGNQGRDVITPGTLRCHSSRRRRAWASSSARTLAGPLPTSVQRVITPSELMEYGEVVYWSGQRTDQQVMDLAMARDAQPDGPVYAAN